MTVIEQMLQNYAFITDEDKTRSLREVMQKIALAMVTSLWHLYVREMVITKVPIQARASPHLQPMFLHSP